MTNTSLAITISPPLRFRNGTKLKNPNRVIFDEDRIQIKAILKYIRCGTYILYPELDPKGRIHYHGIITMDVNQFVRFYKYAYWKFMLIGFVDYKPLKTFIDKMRWIIYMSKSWGFTRDILEISLPILKNSERRKVGRQ